MGMAGQAAELLWTRLPGVEGPIDDLLAVLPDDERARAGRFRIANARGRFVLGRTLLRRTLGGILGVPGEGLAMAVDERGKPRLADPEAASRLHFNLSHSGPLVALAVAAVPVGLDVEALREVANVDRLARRFFSPAEAAAVLDASGSERDRIFLRTWTLKEATSRPPASASAWRSARSRPSPIPTAPPASSPSPATAPKPRAGRWSKWRFRGRCARSRSSAPRRKSSCDGSRRRRSGADTPVPVAVAVALTVTVNSRPAR